MERYVPVVPLRLAYGIVSAAVGDRARVVPAVQASSADELPLVLVQALDPAVLTNGPHTAAARFEMALSCYANDIDAAADLAQHCFASIHDLWYAGFANTYGSLVTLLDPTPPELVVSELEAADTYRFDVAFTVIARAHQKG